MSIDAIINNTDALANYLQELIREDNALRSPRLFAKSITPPERILLFSPTAESVMAKKNADMQAYHSVMFKIAKTQPGYASCYFQMNFYPITGMLTEIFENTVGSTPINYLKTLPKEIIERMANQYLFKGQLSADLTSNPQKTEEALRAVSPQTILNILRELKRQPKDPLHQPR